jgi:hypothetical protein
MEQCRKCTLHFVSATGARWRDSSNDVLAREVQPLRVLEPLLAILAMKGFLDGSQAAQVGVWDDVR